MISPGHLPPRARVALDAERLARWAWCRRGEKCRSSLGAWLAGLLVAWMAGGGVARAHELFRSYIQHRVVLAVGARGVDVTVHLTFFEEGSEHEREHMDINGDGRISRDEERQYLRRSELEWSRAVALRVAGQLIRLIPLSAPELDLLGEDRVGRGHHRLSLRYFARRPATLEPGGEWVVESQLWPGSRALGSLQVEARDGCRLEVLTSGDPVMLPVREGEPREFRARLVRPPRAEREATDARAGTGR